MAVIISQNLTVPPGLAEGSVASASQITPLYNALNAFSIPDSIGTFQQAFVDDTSYSVATGASQDWAFSVVKEKALFFMISFSWSGAAAAVTYALRVNGAAVTAAVPFTNTGTASGLLVGFIGGHDTTNAARSAILLGMDSGTVATLRSQAPNADLPNTDTSSLGIAVGGAGNTTVFKYIKIWKEG